MILHAIWCTVVWFVVGLYLLYFCKNLYHFRIFRFNQTCFVFVVARSMDRKKRKSFSTWKRIKNHNDRNSCKNLVHLTVLFFCILKCSVHEKSSKGRVQKKAHACFWFSLLVCLWGTASVKWIFVARTFFLTSYRLLHLIVRL